MMIALGPLVEAWPREVTVFPVVCTTGADGFASMPSPYGYRILPNVPTRSKPLFLDGGSFIERAQGLAYRYRELILTRLTTRRVTGGVQEAVTG